MQNGDEFFMRQALDEARKAFNKGEVPIGAVVVYGDRIVGRGHNLTETLADPTAHAEMQALTAATGAIGGKYLNECRLYVTVEPCVMCAGACFWCQVGQVIYGAPDPKRGRRCIRLRCSIRKRRFAPAFSNKSAANGWKPSFASCVSSSLFPE